MFVETLLAAGLFLGASAETTEGAHAAHENDNVVAVERADSTTDVVLTATSRDGGKQAMPARYDFC